LTQINPRAHEVRFGLPVQVAGGAGSNEPVGWKLLRLDEATDAVVTHQRSLASRAGYNPGDPIMSVITCQL
jgi:hypothetical protein